MFLMRDEKEERKKQARSNKQTRQSNTAHQRQSFFLRKNELPWVGLEPMHVHVKEGRDLKRGYKHQGNQICALSVYWRQALMIEAVHVGFHRITKKGCYFI